MISSFSNIFQAEQIMWARPIPAAAVVAVFVAVAALTAYLYRRRRGLPTRVHIVLAVSRLVVLCLIVAVLLEPTAVVRRTRTVKRRLPVLIDVSESMSVTDQRIRPEDLVEAAAALDILPFSVAADANRAFMTLDAKQRQAIGSASRLDLARSLMSQSARAMFESLGDDFDVSYYAFGKKLNMLGDGESRAADSLSSLKAAETGTFISESLEAVAGADRGAPLAGIVLLSDGLDTSSRGGEGAIYDLGTRGVPVYPVPMGIAHPDDVSIRNIIMQEVAFSGDKVPVRVQIRSKGYEKRMADLTVLLNDREVARRSISLAGGLQFEDIFFNVDVGEKGAAEVEISIEPFGDEATAENNRVKRSVRVVNEKINVLCMEGSARWEYRYLRAMLKRDPRINATFIATRARAEMARNSSEYIARFPEMREEAFKYDLVILGDVDSAFFTADAFLRLEELVKDRGGSLLMLCGSRFAPTSYAGTPVERMLPVRFDPDGEWEDVDESVYPVLTAEGRSSLVMTLETNTEKNDRVWSRVAPLDRIPPLLAPRPGATVLAELSDSQTRVDRYPLVAWQRYGTGKCMMMGTDRLWLLRFKTGDKYHWRVWSQCIQFLTLSRLMGEHKRIRLETDRATYPVGGQALLYAHVLDDSFEPVTQSGFDVTVSALDGSGGEPQRVTLRPDVENPGLYEGYFSPPGPGRYRMEANSADRSLSNTTEFQVAAIKPEMANTDMQIERLGRIADLSGGKCLSIPRLGELSSLLNRKPHTITVREEVPLWDNWLVAFLLVFLVGFEWIVRRRYDLP
ncbi:MAG: hypothetical protein QGH60_18975 [Phycisphaerae bacterium]|jgi:hypothetical protein|nr:hypothetical protein [Phycisphaerae bacterium]